MNRSLLMLAAAAGLGLVATIMAVIHDSGIRFKAPVAGEPAEQRGATALVAASGIVEAGTGTIAIGTPVAGIVSHLNVAWGQRVNRGETLFQIDDREIANKRPTAVAELVRAEALLKPAVRNSDAAERLWANRFITRKDLIERQSDLAVTRANIVTARAQIDEIDAERARRTVLAPITGRILKINVRPGEFADTMSGAQPVILMGNDDRLNVRAEIDEHDAWRVRQGGSATAYVPGHHALHASLHFERIEPYIQPKTNLTGEGTERTDTRVLQVIYSFDPAMLPVYIGQRVDVLIGEIEPAHTTQRKTR